jgi:hypothetical protein
MGTYDLTLGKPMQCRLGVCPSIRFDRFRREFDFAKSAIRSPIFPLQPSECL